MENKKLIAETVNRFNDILKYNLKQNIRPLIDGETQDCGIIHRIPPKGDMKEELIKVENSKYHLFFSNGSLDLPGKNLTSNKIAQAYSQYVRKLSVPFVFEGIESPGSNSGSMMFNECNVLY
jgi:hypothetical protein